MKRNNTKQSNERGNKDSIGKRTRFGMAVTGFQQIFGKY